MIYRIQTPAKIVVGGWPQFFNCVFHVDASDEAEATQKAELALKQASVSYGEKHIEQIGRRFQVVSNEPLLISGLKYPKDSITQIQVFEGTMQVGIDHIRDGKKESDTIKLWCRPQDFQNALKQITSNIEAKEI